MKRNLFPFLGIAFVVAIAATGIFYGLFVGKISGAAPPAASPAGVVVAARPLDRGMVVTAADVRLQPAGAERPEGSFGMVDDVVGRTVAKTVAANEPVTAGVLAGAKGASGLTIPKGMRAMSIHVADSTGLIPYLRPGNRIDVQVVQTHGGESQARTLLSNVEILNVHADTNPQPAPATIVNLLVPAKDVERVALADSASKVRIVLRNGEDRDEIPVAPAAPSPARAAVAPGPAPAAVGPRVSFQVRMAAAAAETVREIASRAGMTPGGNGAVRIGLLPADWNAEAAMPELEKAKSLRMLSNESVDSPHWHEVSLQAGGAQQGDYDLRLRLTPRGAGNGTVRLRVRPELTLPQRGGLSSRRFSADLNVAEGQSVLVAGFERDAAAPALVEKLFHSPAPQPAGTELLLVVTPRLVAAR
jgi:Flp pilus assembly protein CpaB